MPNLEDHLGFSLRGGAYRSAEKKVLALRPDIYKKAQKVQHADLDFVGRMYVAAFGRHKCFCGRHTKFKNGRKGFDLYCSRYCANNAPGRTEKVETTLKARYGVPSVMLVPAVRDKFKQTMTEKYGANYSWQSASIRAKYDATVTEKFGVSHVSHDPGVLKKRLDSYNRRSSKEKAQSERRRRQTIVENYGSWEAYLATKGNYKTKVVEVSGVTFHVQGYEGYAIQYLVNAKGVNVDSIVTGKVDVGFFKYVHPYKKKECTYFPDLKFVHKRRTWYVEVKSTYTAGLLNKQTWLFKVMKAKALAVHAEDKRMVVVIVCPGQGVLAIPDLHALTRREVLSRLRHKLEQNRR